MEVKSISKKTADLLRGAVFTVKQAHEQIVAAYRAAFEDCCGSDFEETWQSWDDFEEVVDQVEERIRDVVIEAGMAKPVWNKYRSACRNVIFFGVPFKFRSVSAKVIQEARKLADEYDDDSPEKRLTKALKEINGAKGTQYAANAATKGGMTLLRLPQPGEDADQFARLTLERIQHFLDNERVKGMFAAQSVFGTLREQITAALQPPKSRKRKSA